MFKARRLLYHSTLGLRAIKGRRTEGLCLRDSGYARSQATVPTAGNTVREQGNAYAIFSPLGGRETLACVHSADTTPGRMTGCADITPCRMIGSGHATPCRMTGVTLHSSTDSGLVGGVPREQKMLKGHLPRVIYHQVYFGIRRLPASQPQPRQQRCLVSRRIHACAAPLTPVCGFGLKGRGLR